MIAVRTMLPWTYRTFFWGTHGLAIEVGTCQFSGLCQQLPHPLQVVFTALWEYMVSGDLTLKGFSSIWSFFTYGLGVTLFGERIREAFVSQNLPLLVRCIVYVPCFYACEFAFGLLFSALHVCPWDYSEFEYNLLGLITLEYAPFWFAGGIYLEILFSVLDTLEVMPRWKQVAMKGN